MGFWGRRLLGEKRDKLGMELAALGWTILAIAAAAVIIGGYIYLKAKGISAIEFVQNLFRFGR